MEMDMPVAVHRTAVGRDAPRRDLEERRFAGAVATEHHPQLSGHGAQRSRRQHAPAVE
jgi:hypothetical protein